MEVLGKGSSIAVTATVLSLAKEGNLAELRQLLSQSLLLSFIDTNDFYLHSHTRLLALSNTATANIFCRGMHGIAHPRYYGLW